MEDFKIEAGENHPRATAPGLTYCERGQEHDEVVVFPQVLFSTFMDIMGQSPKRYHVYGLIMRFRGPPTSSTGQLRDWAKQWGKDQYEFYHRLMGIRRFIHFGKCHSTTPAGTWSEPPRDGEGAREASSWRHAPERARQTTGGFR